MLAHRIPSEAELKPDLDVGTPLSVELPSAMKVIAGEASPAAGRQVARTVVSDTPTSAAIWLTDMAMRARSRICCFFAALIGRQVMLRMPWAVVISLSCSVGATLDALDSGGTLPTMRRLRKASRGSQLFGLILPRCTDVSSQHHEGLQTRTRSSVSSACSGPCRFHRLDPRHR